MICRHHVPLCEDWLTLCATENFSQPISGHDIFSLFIRYCSGENKIFRDLQLQDQDDVLSVLVDLVEVDDVVVLHLGEDVDLLLDVVHGHAPPARLQSFLLDVLCGVLVPVPVTIVGPIFGTDTC